MTSKTTLCGTTSQYILQTSKEYSIYVCSTRAIPSIEDGLKAGQRVALWLLKDKAEKMKTVALSGLMAYTKLYVHGDISASNAIGLLAAPYKNNVPLIEGLGQFGSRCAPVEGIGAPRYTEVRRAQSAQLLLYRDLDLVPLEDNYDGSNVQPVHFLPLVPLVLLNGVEGVAVGWSTSIQPRKLKDLITATQDALMGKVPKLLKPHYENYGIDVKHLGGNQWEFHGKAEIVDTSTVHISELPPGISVEKFNAQLAAMEERDQIASYTEGSTEFIDVTVKFKRGSVRDWTPATAIDFFKLKEKVTERITVIDWGGETIRTYDTAEDVIVAFAAWRLRWYTERYKKMISDAKYELIYWKVIQALFAAGFTAKLGKFANRAAVEDEVAKVAGAKKLSLDKPQMDRVVSLSTYRWTEEYRDEVTLKVKEIEGAIKGYQDVLKSDDKLRAVYMAELDEVKKKLT